MGCIFYGQAKEITKVKGNGMFDFLPDFRAVVLTNFRLWKDVFKFRFIYTESGDMGKRKIYREGSEKTGKVESDKGARRLWRKMKAN